MNQQEAYTPISCDEYDILESLSTLKRHCEIAYRDENEQEAVVHDTITDIYTQDRQEFLKLGRGTIIRLDDVLRVNDKILKSRRCAS